MVETHIFISPHLKDGKLPLQQPKENINMSTPMPNLWGFAHDLREHHAVEEGVVGEGNFRHFFAPSFLFSLDLPFFSPMPKKNGELRWIALDVLRRGMRLGRPILSLKNREKRAGKRSSFFGFLDFSCHVLVLSLPPGPLCSDALDFAHGSTKHRCLPWRERILNVAQRAKKL